MCTTSNEEYNKRYMNLFYLLQQAYVDRYLLEELAEYKEEIDQHEKAIRKCSYSVLGHISGLLKMELCLVLWKVYCDKDVKANTIHTLNRYLRSSTRKNYETKISKDLRGLESMVVTARMKWLAHNDQNPEELEMLTADLYLMLDEICELLNGMLEKDLASNVIAFDEEIKDNLQKKCVLGLKELIYRDKDPVVILQKQLSSK